MLFVFNPDEIVQRVRSHVDDSFYATLNKPPHRDIGEPLMLAGTGPISMVNASGMIFAERKEPRPFHSVVDQFQHIEDRISERRQSIFRASRFNLW